MALHPEFPKSPYADLLPDQRWFPAAEELRSTAYEKLLPPLVAKIRVEVSAWRATGYAGASDTSRSLLNWWFETEHLVEQADGALSPFRYYFAQREAVETVIWLHDVRKVQDKFDLMRYSSLNEISPSDFDENWPRYVVKMATGAGKTKVLSLLIAWSFFHKLYETDSTLARNFLLIAPNIIVLDRLRADFDGLRIFFNDPILPDNGHEGHNWRDDFQLTLHIQDDVRVVRQTKNGGGNLFLTNIHRVYLGDVREPSLDDEDLRDYFLDPFGVRPVGKTTDSKTDLGEIVREIDELAVFNDEAHHIHDPRMAWFKSIQDIHHRMLQKDTRLSLQVDVPKVTIVMIRDNNFDNSQPAGEILLYQTEDGKTRLEVQLKGETVWLTQKQMAELFQKDVRTISEHIRNVYDEGELAPDPTIRNFRIVQSEGKRRIEREVSGVDSVAVSENPHPNPPPSAKGADKGGSLTVPSPAKAGEGEGGGTFEERWTGSYIFENEWQSFRTRKNRDLEFISAPHAYTKAGRYTVAVKVIDIFGNDTMVLVPVNVG